MTRYRPLDQPWHEHLKQLQPCNCDEAYAGRGMLDSRCWFHNAIEVVETLREYGWTVEPPGHCP